MDVEWFSHNARRLNHSEWIYARFGYPSGECLYNFNYIKLKWVRLSDSEPQKVQIIALMGRGRGVVCLSLIMHHQGGARISCTLPWVGMGLMCQFKKI